MKGLGGLLVLYGVGCIVLPQLDMHYSILSWVDTWDTDVGWGIKIALILLGVGLWFMAGSKGQARPSP